MGPMYTFAGASSSVKIGGCVPRRPPTRNHSVSDMNQWGIRERFCRLIGFVVG